MTPTFTVKVKTTPTIQSIVNDPTLISAKTQDIIFAGITNLITEVPSGLINEINTTFYTSNNFTSPFVQVYLNGLKLVSDDYIITAPNQIDLIEAPVTGDILEISYIK
jgi:hypothetical protein